MKLTRETDYALRGLAALVRRTDSSPVALAELAAAEGLPASFLAKIFQKLARHGILESVRGAGNGYSLALEPSALSVLRVIEATEGSDFLDRCLFWGGRCGSDHPCILHERWMTVKPEFTAMLDLATVADLAAGSATLAGGRVQPAGGRDRGDQP